MAQIVVKHIETNSGFLEHAHITFSPKLNCIIGARGTCKSTLIESLRFVLNSDPIRVESHDDHENASLHGSLP